MRYLRGDLPHGSEASIPHKQFVILLQLPMCRADVAQGMLEICVETRPFHGQGSLVGEQLEAVAAVGATVDEISGHDDQVGVPGQDVLQRLAHGREITLDIGKNRDPHGSVPACGFVP
jgi:hypothetical protein